MRLAALLIVISVALLTVALIVLYFVIRHYLRRLQQGIQTLGTSQFAPPPARIHLQRVAEPSPPDFGSGLLASFGTLGFAAIGQYTITEMPGVKVHAMALADDGIYAFLYEHPRAGIWYELSSRLADGRVVSASTLPDTGLDRAPHRLAANLPIGTAPADGLARLRELRPADGVPVRVSADDFVATFQYNYAEDMDWRIGRGGPTDEEIHRVAAKKGQPVTPEGLAAIHAKWRALAEEAKASQAAEPTGKK